MSIMENERITKCDIVYTATNIKNELDSFTISQAFNKLQRYECLGTIEEFKALKEKSVAKKPRWHGHHFCPNCDSIVYVNCGKDIYCPKCGQKLDWQ